METSSRGVLVCVLLATMTACGVDNELDFADGTTNEDLIEWSSTGLSDVAPGPGGDPVLCIPPFLVPGEPYAIEVSGVAIGEKVTLLGGGSVGSGSCPAALGGLCLDIPGASVLGSAFAQPDGVATLTGAVPAGISAPGAMFVQAVVKRGPGGVDSVKSEAVRGNLSVDESLPGNCDEPTVCFAEDTDLDGTQDLCDVCPADPADDADGDGVCGDVDVCPGGDDLMDGDSDGIPDSCDACPSDAANDADADGVCGDADICPGGDDLIDTDGDGTPDACDSCPGDVFNDIDGDGSCVSDGDCDDFDPSAYPSALEVCGDMIDNDCDGTFPIDEVDLDGDGKSACGGDCNDLDPTVGPLGIEVCDGIDNNCDGKVDEDMVDGDGDGVCDALDPCPIDPADADADGDGVCDDTSHAPEGSGVDTDGDGIIDDSDPCPDDSLNDFDGDGVCASDGDCDDLDVTAYPSAIEVCGDMVDNDCDGTFPIDELDLDGDGVPTCGEDCDDLDPTVGPFGIEVCDGIDNDCDFMIDEDMADDDGDDLCDSVDPCPGDPDNADTDGDGVCDEVDPCPADSHNDEDGDGVCVSDGDCDDHDPTRYPSALEVCGDVIDNDCDGTFPIDEIDQDGDGVLPCDGDCNDFDPAIGPFADEACDGIDNDCNKSVDDGLPVGESSDGSCDPDAPEYAIVVGPKTFLDGHALYISVAGFGDGSAGIVYRDDDDGYAGKLAIYSPYGVPLRDPTLFASTTRQTSAASLSDGNVLVAHFEESTEASGKLAVFDSSGTEVVAPTEFAQTQGDLAAVGMDNGNAFLAWEGGNFGIYDVHGAAFQVAEDLEGDAFTGPLGITSLFTGQVFAAYSASMSAICASEHCSGRIAVFDADGTAGTPVDFGLMDPNSGMAASTLGDGNVVVAYDDATGGGTFTIFDPAGTEVVAPTEFTSSALPIVSATTLRDGSVLIAYKHTDTNAGEFVRVLDSSESLSAVTEFADSIGHVDPLSATTLLGGEVMIGFSDLGDGNKGKFVIVDDCGPGDVDGDGVHACDGDCNDGDAAIGPFAADVCDGVDNDCDTEVDEGLPDSDLDGVCDEIDPCPGDNPDDTDGDGVCDSDDICITGDDALDADGDGVPDACDPCPADATDDTDHDSVCDSDDPCPLDNPDDSDSDGVCDSHDPCPFDDPDDSDGDGVCDTDDICPGGGDGHDADADGVPDPCDPCPFDNPDDRDDDGVCDSVDPCPLDNPDDTDGDGVCDADDLCPSDDPDDTDGDGVCDTDDLCPGADDNTDTDTDGVPDGCDPCPVDKTDDTDGDGVCNSDDPCPLDNPDDTDGDGVCDIDDPCPLDNPDDTDLDGICDSEDNCPGDDAVSLASLHEGDLVVTEIMRDPRAASNTDGKYFEVVNLSGADVDLGGLVLSDLDEDSFAVEGCVIALDGQYFVFGQSADSAINGGYTADYEYGDAMSLSNDDQIILSYDVITFDIVELDGGDTFPNPRGASLSLAPAHTNAADNDDGANWCESVSVYGDGDHGTPGAANDDGDADGDGECE